MAKKKVNYRLGDGSILSILKQNTSKNGKLRGRNKRETKILRGACVHHTLNKKGKVKTTIDTSKADGTCYCRQCGNSFKIGSYSKGEVKNVLTPVKDVVNNLKFLAVAVSAGPDTVRYSAELGSMLELLPKTYGNVSEIAVKATSSKGKKKHNKNRYDANNSYGAWGRQNR